MVFKLVLMSLCGVLLALKAAAAQEYQRKQVMPEFFIPQQALPKPEKLPPIKFSTLAPHDDAVKKVSLQAHVVLCAFVCGNSGAFRIQYI